jgi:hypothetical protein
MRTPRIITELIRVQIVDHYSDSRIVGRDDITRDYLSICYNGDKYIQNCFESGLKLEDRNLQVYEFFTVYNYDYDPNAVSARYPRKGHYFNVNRLEFKFNMLRLAYPFYNENEHFTYLNSEEHKKRQSLLANTLIEINQNKKDYEWQEEIHLSIKASKRGDNTTFKEYPIWYLDKEINNSKLISYFEHLYLSETS